MKKLITSLSAIVLASVLFTSYINHSSAPVSQQHSIAVQKKITPVSAAQLKTRLFIVCDGSDGCASCGGSCDNL
jgi:hypothetical protein